MDDKMIYLLRQSINKIKQQLGDDVNTANTYIKDLLIKIRKQFINPFIILGTCGIIFTFLLQIGSYIYTKLFYSFDFVKGHAPISVLIYYWTYCLYILFGFFIVIAIIYRFCLIKTAECDITTASKMINLIYNDFELDNDFIKELHSIYTSLDDMSIDGLCDNDNFYLFNFYNDLFEPNIVAISITHNEQKVQHIKIYRYSFELREEFDDDFIEDKIVRHNYYVDKREFISFDELMELAVIRNCPNIFVNKKKI